MHRRGRPSLLRVLLAVAGAGLVGYLLLRVLRRRPPAGSSGQPVITDRAAAPRRPPITPRLPIVDPTVVEVGDVEYPGEPQVGTDGGAEVGAEVAAEPVLKAEPVVRATKAVAERAPAKRNPPVKKAAAKKAAAKKAVAKKKAAVKKAVAKKKAAVKKAPARKASLPPDR